MICWRMSTIHSPTHTVSSEFFGIFQTDMYKILLKKLRVCNHTDKEGNSICVERITNSLHGCHGVNHKFGSGMHVLP